MLDPLGNTEMIFPEAFFEGIREMQYAKEGEDENMRERTEVGRKGSIFCPILYLIYINTAVK